MDRDEMNVGFKGLSSGWSKHAWPTAKASDLSVQSVGSSLRQNEQTSLAVIT
jgi:hypothetical protein